MVTYTVEAENGLDPGSYDGGDGFAHDVDATLADPRRVSLTSPLTTRSRQLCGFDIRYEGSCFEDRDALT